jgi:hypothetical protein
MKRRINETLGAPRNLTSEEFEFLGTILRRGEVGDELIQLLADVVVQEMNDGGMGSLRFKSKGATERKLGRCVVEAEFLDRDGVCVSVAVNLDDRGELFELDIWKVDFSPLIAFPISDDIVLRPWGTKPT